MLTEIQEPPRVDVAPPFPGEVAGRRAYIRTEHPSPATPGGIRKKRSRRRTRPAASPVMPGGSRMKLGILPPARSTFDAGYEIEAAFVGPQPECGNA